MLRGELTGLRAIERADLEPLRQWRNRPDYRRFFRETKEISSEQQNRWYETAVLSDPNTIMFAIDSLEGKELIGACGLCYADRLNLNADLSIYIGADGRYIDDHYAPDATRTLLRYAFEEQNLHRIWCEIYDFDEAKKALFEELGFSLDGRHRETHWTEGRWVDSLFFSLLSREFAA